MGHPITIDSDEAYALATELAALTGETIEVAVTAAVRQRLAVERLQTERRAEKTKRVRAITAEMRALMPQDASALDMGDLYDERGLPI